MTADSLMKTARPTAADRRKTVLVYDADAYGHHFEYIGHFIHSLARIEAPDRYHFLVHAKTLDYFSREIEQLAINGVDFAHFHALTAEETARFERSPSTFKRALAERAVLETYLREYAVEELILLQVDQYQFILGAWSLNTFRKLTVKGILFHPYNQTPKSVSRMKRWRKRLQLHWALGPAKRSKLFVLNDSRSVRELNARFLFADRFAYLADPIPVREYRPIDLRARYGIPSDNHLFLVIGGITVRKNIPRILEAFGALPAEAAESATLLLLGRCTDDRLLRTIADHQQQTTRGRVIFDNTFLDEDAFESALVTADTVLITYKDFYPSSGIIGHAAKHRVPVIASDYGVIGHLTEKYRLGQTVSPDDTAALRAALLNALQERRVYRGDPSFVRTHTPDNFVATLLEKQVWPA